VITIRFEPWYPLVEAGSNAPAGPGVYQLRIRTGLLSYPTGKSAMVHYAAAPNLVAAITAYASAHPDADLLCRHQAAPDPVALYTQLLTRFVTRFGAEPGNAAD
jgi:hypothetical protein